MLWLKLVCKIFEISLEIIEMKNCSFNYQKLETWIFVDGLLWKNHQNQSLIQVNDKLYIAKAFKNFLNWEQRLLKM